jgi:hypothetical protein
MQRAAGCEQRFQMAKAAAVVDLRELLGRYAALAPARPPGFDEELWRRIGAHERAAARRARVVAAVATAIAIAATSAAGVLAFGGGARGLSTVDRTLTCPVPERGGVNLLKLFARVKGSPPTTLQGYELSNPATVEVDAGRMLLFTAGVPHIYQATYAGASPALKGGYTFDERACVQARSIPLTAAGLQSAGTFRGTHGAGLARECWLAPLSTIRLRVTVTNSGVPVAAKLALRSGKKLRPIAYVDWTPTLVRAWATSDCHEYLGP